LSLSARETTGFAGGLRESTRGDWLRSFVRDIPRLPSDGDGDDSLHAASFDTYLSRQSSGRFFETCNIATSSSLSAARAAVLRPVGKLSDGLACDFCCELFLSSMRRLHFAAGSSSSLSSSLLLATAARFPSACTLLLPPFSFDSRALD